MFIRYLYWRPVLFLVPSLGKYNSIYLFNFFWVITVRRFEIRYNPSVNLLAQVSNRQTVYLKCVILCPIQLFILAATDEYCPPQICGEKGSDGEKEWTTGDSFEDRTSSILFI